MLRGYFYTPIMCRCPSITITLGTTSYAVSKDSPLPQFLDEEVALIVNDDSSPRADTQRVAHSVSGILLKGGLRLPKASSWLSGLFQEMRWGPSGSYFERSPLPCPSGRHGRADGSSGGSEAPAHLRQSPPPTSARKAEGQSASARH